MASVDYEGVKSAGSKWVDDVWPDDLNVQVTWPNMYTRSQQVNCTPTKCEYVDYLDSLPEKLASGEFHKFDKTYTDLTLKGPRDENDIGATVDGVE